MSSTPGAGPSRRTPTASKPFSSTFSLPARRAPQSTKGRLSTFADASSLRLHPDGSRVPVDPSNASKGKGLVAKSLKNAGPDARGRWYARDATGSAKIPRERRVREEEEIEEAVQEELQIEDALGKGKGKEVATEDVEIFDLDVATQEGVNKGKEPEEEEVVDEKELRRRERRRRENEAKRVKRARFKEDLRTGRDLVPDTPSLAKDESLPPPDFLKVIHHFASNYYAHAGVLTDKSREYRAVKKARAERRTARLFEQGKGEIDEEETDSSHEEDGGASSSSRPTKRARRSRSASRVTRSSRSSSRRSHSRSERGEDGAEDEDEGGGRNPIVKQPDMYKAFSGKGLMAIGILMQEFIAAQVTREPPENWLEGALLEGKMLAPASENQEHAQDPLDEEDKEDEEEEDPQDRLGGEDDSDKEDEDEDVPRSSDDEKSSSSASDADD